jgi:histidinol phosphatase-like PHP family hydrolase
MIRRCEVAGYSAVAIGDHVGLSNVRFVVESHVRLCESVRGLSPVRTLPGAELTHVHPELIERTTRAAREAGAAVVLGHGESLVEPVAPGSNRAYIEARVDVLAHPGLIEVTDARRAAELGVCLEISGRRGHCFTNGHVARVARETGARLVFGTDSHHYEDLMDRSMAERVARGAAMTDGEVETMFANAEEVFRRGEGQ